MRGPSSFRAAFTKAPAPLFLLLPIFALTALIYAAAGFGGGSTYTAVLALWAQDVAVIPIIALSCNIIVVSAGAWRFAREGHVDWRRIWPFFAASIPMAFVGGMLPVPRIVFIGLLSVSLFVAGLLMLWKPRARSGLPPLAYPRWLEPLVGGLLGLLAGIVGIGGGIYLSPVLHLLRWGGAHAIAGTSAVFILANSLSGLGGQLAKSGSAFGEVMGAHWMLFPAVLIGGAIGSLLGARTFDPHWLRILTGLLILFVAGQLAVRFFAFL